MRSEKLPGFGERIREKMGDKSIRDLAGQIEKSYEMTRRYVKGWAIPDDPAVLERLAIALNTTVGNLVSGEQDNTRLPPRIQAGEITGPVKETMRVVVEDAAMTMTVLNIRLFGIGDEVTVTPTKPLPGDVVLVMHGKSATLRSCSQSQNGMIFKPNRDDYATLENAPVLGVVTKVTGQIIRG